MTVSSDTSPEPNRIGLLESAFAFSPLETVCKAVSAATEIDPEIFIERQGDGFRWSFTSKEGAFVLLEKVARFLGIDQSHLLVGFRTLDDGTFVVHDDRVDFEPSEESALISFSVPTTESEVAAEIRRRFSVQGD